MHAAAAETGGFADRVQSLDRLAIGTQDTAVEIGLQAAQRLAGQDVEPDRDQRPIGRIEHLVRPSRADQPVAEIGASASQGGDLHVFAERIVELPVTAADLALDLRQFEQRLAADKRVHAGDQRRQIRLDDEILALVHERLHRTGNA